MNFNIYKKNPLLAGELMTLIDNTYRITSDKVSWENPRQRKGDNFVLIQSIISGILIIGILYFYSKSKHGDFAKKMNTIFFFFNLK